MLYLKSKMVDQIFWRVSFKPRFSAKSASTKTSFHCISKGPFAALVKPRYHSTSAFFSQAIPYYFPWLQVPVHWPHQFPDSWMASHYWTLPWLMRPATLCPTLQPSACLISTFSEGMSFRQLTFLTRKSGTFWMCWSQHAHHEVKAHKR